MKHEFSMTACTVKSCSITSPRGVSCFVTKEYVPNIMIASELSMVPSDDKKDEPSGRKNENNL